MAAELRLAQEIDKRIRDVAARVIRKPHGVLFDVVHQPFKVVTRIGNANHADGRALPRLAGLHLGNGNVEVRPQSVLNAAHYLAFVLDGMRAFNANLEPEIRNHDLSCCATSRNRLLLRRNRPGTIVCCVLYEGFGRYFLGDEVLDDISYLDVAVIGDGDAALHSIPHFADIFLEPPHRANFALEHDHIVAQQANFGVTLDYAIGDQTAGDGTHLGNTESVAHFGAAEIRFLDDRFEQAGHGPFDLVLQFVNDGVQTDVNLFLLRQFLRLAFRPHIETDDYGVRRRGQQDVGFGDGAHATKQDLDLHSVVRKLGQQVAQDFH